MDATTTALAKLLASFGITLVLGTAGAVTTATTPQQYVAPPARAAVSVSVPANSGNSENWSGYVAQNGTYTSVSGSWVVPAVINPSAGSADATWVGIGGARSRDLIQAGTEALPADNGSVVYRAWYELLPGNSRQIPLAVSPGDSISVSVTLLPAQTGESDNAWLISFNNNTTGKSYQTTVNYNSSLSSAEWIEEMPVALDGPLSLDNFGSVNFTSGLAIKDGSAVTIQGSGAQPLQMQNSAGETVAAPSALGTDGSSFSIVRTGAAASALAMTPSGRVLPTFAAGQTGFDPQPQVQLMRSYHHRDGERTVIVRFFSE